MVNDLARWRHRTLIFLGGFTVLRLLFIGFGPLALSPDEAYFWEWARHPAWCYYDMTPMVAWVIAAFVKIFGSSEFVVRLPAVLLALAASVLLFELATELFASSVVGFGAVLLMNIVPIGAAGGVIHTYYSEQVFFWVLSLFLFRKAVTAGRMSWWVGLGVSLGLGLLSHHTFFILTFQLFLYLLLSSQSRRWLARVEPYMAGVLALIVFSPAMIWNLQNNMVTFRHAPGQLGHNSSVAKTFFVDFLGGQAGVITPFIWIAVVVSLALAVRRAFAAKDDRWLFLFTTSAPLLVYVGCIAFGRRVEANWPVSAYVSGFIAASAAYGLRQNRGGWLRIYVAAALGLAGVATLLSHLPALLTTIYDLPTSSDPSNRLYGWRELGKEVSGIIGEDKTVFVCAMEYGIASELGFYVNGHPHSYCLPVAYRRTQFLFWNLNQEIGRDAIYVRTGTEPVEPQVSALFASVDAPQRLIIPKTGSSQIRKEYSIYRCRGFRGYFGPDPARY